MHKDLTKVPILSNLLRMSYSMSWGLFAVIGFNLADTYFISQLGTTELAAISLSFPIILVFFSLTLGIATSVSSLVSRSIGERNDFLVKRYTSDSLTLGLIIVFFSVIIGFTFMKPALLLLGASDTTLPIVMSYLKIWFSGMVFLAIPMIGNGAIRAKGNMKIASLIMVVSAIINILLDPILIFGWGVIPAYGVDGAAYATVIARMGTLIASLYFLHFKYGMIDFKKPELKIAINSWKKILHIGIPAAGTNLLTPIAVAVITGVISRLGENHIAAYGVVNKVESFAFIFILALSSALGPMVGHNFGAKNIPRVKESVQVALSLTFKWGLLMSAILYFFSDQVMSLFTNDLSVIESGKKYLVLVPLTYGVYGLRIIISSFFNTVGKPVLSTFLGMFYFIVLLVPFSIIGSKMSGIEGLYLGHFMSYLIIGLISLYLLKKYLMSIEEV